MPPLPRRTGPQPRTPSPFVNGRSAANRDRADQPSPNARDEKPSHALDCWLCENSEKSRSAAAKKRAPELEPVQPFSSEVIANAKASSPLPAKDGRADELAEPLRAGEPS